MIFDFCKLSNNYEIRRITEDDLEEVFQMCRKSPYYYEKMNSVVSVESLRKDLNALPPGKGYEDKYFLGFYRDRELIAIMDLIEGFPEKKTAWIGLFIMNQSYQRQGIGTKIVEEAIAHLERTGHACVQLGYVKDNLQSSEFWKNNHFCPTGKETRTPDYTIVVAERKLEHTNTTLLETERLILRKFTENDMEALFAIYKDEEVNTYLPWFPLKSIEEAGILFKEKYAQVYEQPMGYQYAICLKSDNIPIGYVKVDLGDNHDLGYGLRKEFWHRGIVTEASKAVVEQVKKDGLRYITATHDIKNPRSGGVMKRLGMEYKYSYEEQWQPKNILVTFRMYQLNFDGNHDWVYKEYWDQSEVHWVETEVSV